MDNTTELRELLKDMQDTPELVLQVLLEQGWITENGEIGSDLVPVFDDAVEAAFENPLGE